MDVVFSIAGCGPFSGDDKANAVAALENGRILVLPDCGFALHPDEESLLSPAVLHHAKNVSLAPSGKLKHAAGTADQRNRLQAMMARFAGHAADLVDALIPRYRGRLERARTSFRPAEIEGRRCSLLQDDTRLHVDAFPSKPMARRRILRVFTNVNPAAPRVWQVAESFYNLAGRFLPQAKTSPAVLNRLRTVLGITKGCRTPYDDVMLALHDCAKRDEDFQRICPKTRLAFAPGTTWLCYTDQTIHAALKGRHALEQTFHLPVEAMADPERAPLRVLERMTGRKLA